MFYEPRRGDHGLPHDPFKALVVPRPIGWIGTVSGDGTPNLAPYSYFNAVADRPPMVMFSSQGRKDSLRNVEETGEFTWSLATLALRDAMNLSSAPVDASVDEIALAGLTHRPSRLVAAPSVAESPASFECRLWRVIDLPEDPAHPDVAGHVVLGEVVGVHLDETVLRDGLVDAGSLQPLSRLGYMDYGVLTPETTFTMSRPTASDDGLSADVDPAPWDGVYR